LPNALPFLKLGRSVFDINFPVGNVPDLQLKLGAILLPKLDQINAIRQGNARKIIFALKQTKAFDIPGSREEPPLAYLRLPVMAPSRAERDAIIVALRKLDIMASTMYPLTIRRIPGIEQYLASNDNDFPGAQTIVDRLLVLPTHPMLIDSDIQKIINCLQSAGRMTP